MSMVLSHDTATGLHIASDGKYMMVCRDGEQSKPGYFDVDIVDLSNTMDPGKMVKCGSVHLRFGQSTWIGVSPNRSLLHLGDTFLPFLEHNHVS